MTTRAELRSRVGANLGALLRVRPTVHSTTELTVDASGSDAGMIGRYVYVGGADYRIVNERFVVTDAHLTVSGAIPAGEIGEEAELWDSISPSEVNNFINQAIADAQRRYYTPSPPLLYAICDRSRIIPRPATYHMVSAVQYRKLAEALSLRLNVSDWMIDNGGVVVRDERDFRFSPSSRFNVGAGRTTARVNIGTMNATGMTHLEFWLKGTFEGNVVLHLYHDDDDLADITVPVRPNWTYYHERMLNPYDLIAVNNIRVEVNPGAAGSFWLDTLSMVNQDAAQWNDLEPSVWKVQRQTGTIEVNPAHRTVRNNMVRLIGGHDPQLLDADDDETDLDSQYITARATELAFGPGSGGAQVDPDLKRQQVRLWMQRSDMAMRSLPSVSGARRIFNEGYTPPGDDTVGGGITGIVTGTGINGSTSHGVATLELARPIPPGYVAATSLDVDTEAKRDAFAAALQIEASGIEAEILKRVSGDDIQASVVATEISLTGALAAQLNEDTPHLLRFSREVRHSGETYAVNDVIYLPPRSNAVERWFNLGDAVIPDAVLNNNVLTKGLFTQALWNTLIAGDDRDTTEISSAGGLDIWLAGRANAAKGAYIQVTEEVRGMARGKNVHLVKGTVAYIRPRTTDPDHLAIIAVPNGGNYFGQLEITPSNIDAVGDVQRDYQVKLSDVAVDYLTANHANSVEFTMNGFAFHVVENWAPVTSALIVVNVNATEALGIDLTNQTSVPIAAVFRRRLAGSSTYVAEIGGILTIGGVSGGGGEGGEDATARLAARAAAAAAAANAVRLSLVAPFSDIQIEPPGIADNLFPSRLTFLFGTKQTSKVIRQVRVVDAFGNTVHTEAGDVFSGDIIVAEISNDEIITLQNNIGNDDTSTDVSLYIDYADGSDSFRRRWRFPVNNSDFEAAGTDETARKKADANSDRLDTAEKEIKALEDATGTPERDIGGASVMGSPSQWTAYPITADIEADAYYKFVMRVRGSDRFMPTQAFKGSDLLACDVTAAGNWNANAEVVGVNTPRPNADGARTLFVARTANARQLLLRINDTYDPVRLTRLQDGGPRGLPGPVGPAATDWRGLGQPEVDGYVILVTDKEFLVELHDTNAPAEHFNLEFKRFQLSTNPKHFVDASGFSTSAAVAQGIGITVALNATGNRLSVALYEIGLQNTSNLRITGVHAR